MNSLNGSIEKTTEEIQKEERIAAQKLPIFVNLIKLKDKLVTVVLTNGITVYGRLVAFDEAFNLVIEKSEDWQFGKKVLCLGRCLSMVCLGNKTIL